MGQYVIYYCNTLLYIIPNVKVTICGAGISYETSDISAPKLLDNYTGVCAYKLLFQLFIHNLSNCF